MFLDDEPEPCPECGHVALLPVRAAELPGPLLYLCGNCHESVAVDVYERWWQHQQQQMAAAQQPRRLTLKERILGASHAQ
jgi:hypothetical protein